MVNAPQGSTEREFPLRNDQFILCRRPEWETQSSKRECRDTVIMAGYDNRCEPVEFRVLTSQQRSGGLAALR